MVWWAKSVFAKWMTMFCHVYNYWCGTGIMFYWIGQTGFLFNTQKNNQK